MEVVRSPSGAGPGVSTQELCPTGRRDPPRILNILTPGVLVLDIIYILVVVACFGVIALVAAGVEKL